MSTALRGHPNFLGVFRANVHRPVRLLFLPHVVGRVARGGTLVLVVLSPSIWHVDPCEIKR